MRIRYQRGTVYVRGTKPQMWYGRFLLYQRDKNGKEVRKQRNVPICPKAGVPKTRAAQMLQQIILKEGTVPGKPSALPPDDSVTFEWFTRQRYVPMRQGKWSPAYRQTNGYAIEHYLISRFGDTPLRDLDTFSIQVYLNQLAEKYRESLVHQAYSNVRAILRLARKQKYLVEDPAEDVVLPLTMPVEKPVIDRGQILAVLGAVTDLRDLCLLSIGIFSGPRASEVFGLQWKCWTGESLLPRGTAYDGKLYPGRLKTKASKGTHPTAVYGFQKGTDCGAGVRLVHHRSLEEHRAGHLARGPNVSDLWQRRTEGGAGSVLQQELPANADSPDRRAARRPRPSHHLSGDAAHAGNRSAKPRHAQRCAGRVASCQHHDYRERVRTAHRRERLPRGELARECGR